jgi:hypothetical protein
VFEAAAAREEAPMSRRRRWAEDDVAGLERWPGVGLPAEFRQYPR